MKTTKRTQRRLGNLLFFLPIIVIGSLIVYAFIEISAPGKMEVTALGHDPYVSSLAVRQGTSITASFYVQDSTGKNISSGSTPAILSLGSGTYTVTFIPQKWYTTPTDETLQVSSSTTVYSVGVYQVIPLGISVTPGGFNSTKVTALQGVTPVIWINTSGSLVLLHLESIGTVPLDAGQNYTMIFQQIGPVSYSLGSNETGTLQVV